MACGGGRAASGPTETCGAKDVMINLSSYMNMDKIGCLNADNKTSVKSILAGEGKLRSDCDEQLLIVVPFREHVKIRSIRIKSVASNDGESGPKRMKLFIDRDNFTFDDAENTPAVQELKLDSKKLDGSDIKLDFVKFQSVPSITLFVPSNLGDTEVTVLNRLEFIGCAKQGTNMGELKKSG